MTLRSPYDLAPDDLTELLTELGEPSYRARQVAHWLDRRHVADPEAMTDLPAGLRGRLAERWQGAGLRLLSHQTGDAGWTHKFLFGLPGGDAVETVLMFYPPAGMALPTGVRVTGRSQTGSNRPGHSDPDHSDPGPGGLPAAFATEEPAAGEEPPTPAQGRATVCISTQAGCAMGCTFCATGLAGFTRHLTVGEVVEQVAHVWARIPELRPAPEAPDHVTNVVFMGMGEPFANPAATWGAVHRLHDGFGLGARGITVSTVGVVPQIRRAATEPVRANLAVSIHAPDDELRNQLVPLNRTWPVAELLDAVQAYVDATRRRVSFEYALLGGVNDQPEHGAALGRLLAALRLPGGGRAAHVNAIPWNPTDASYDRPTGASIRAFRDAVADQGIPVTIRANRGVGIDAACGQLRTSQGRPGRRVLPLASGTPGGNAPGVDGFVGDQSPAVDPLTGPSAGPDQEGRR